MQFQRLTDHTDPRYPHAMALYEASFPLHEQREADAQKDILSNPDYHFYLIYDEGSWVGLILCWTLAQSIYVEHFCILPEMRGKRYGQKALALLQRMGKPIILEIDPPVDETSIGRKAFYVRAGFQTNPFPHLHPPYRAGYEGHRLLVLSYPARLSEGDYQTFSEHLNRVVMRP